MKHILTLSLALAALVGPGMAAPIAIDSFSIDQTTVSMTTYIEDPSILGGETEISFLGGAVEAEFKISGGQGTLSNVVNATERNFQLVYDGVDATTSIDHDGLGGLDLTDGGENDRFSIDLASVTGTIDITVSVYSESNENLSGYQMPGITSGGVIEILFDDLNVILGTGADMTNVGMFFFSFRVDSGDGFVINNIEIPSDYPADTAAPSVKVTNKKKYKKPRRAHTIKGTATDDIGVTRVEVKVPRSPYKNARLLSGNRWKFRARKLKSGKNRVKIRAYDAKGKVSAIKKIKVVGK